MAIEKGKLIRWLDEKGFGFIKPENGKNDLFIHISAIKSNRKPIIGDTILYEIDFDATGKPRATNAIIEGVSQPLTLTPLKSQYKSTHPTTNKSHHKPYKSNSHRHTQRVNLFPLLIFIGIAVFVYIKSSKKNLIDVPIRISEPAKQVEQFQCQGKIHCSEMTSYDEAVFYLQNCPGTKMDGDGDGEPCERQF